ncbi:hypothetical protein FQR65_LT19214 [Abscondita terminalis]|nr:hypothetical protein FQR65_LT19214 [Abscondita terminalis]
MIDSMLGYNQEEDLQCFHKYTEAEGGKLYIVIKIDFKEKTLWHFFKCTNATVTNSNIFHSDLPYAFVKELSKKIYSD